MTNEKLRTAITMLVAFVWGLTGIVGVITHDYTGLGIVTPMMMLAGGFLFGFGRRG